jgi:two-component system, OmpR family, sensor kinase
VSLRTRLLLVLGAVVVVALVATSLATYSSLRSFLFSRVDQDLQQTHQPIEAALSSGRDGPHSDGCPFGQGGAGPGPGYAPFLSVAPETYIEERTPSGQAVCVQPAHLRGGGAAQSPKLPSTIKGFSYGSDPHEPTVYFTAASARAGGPQFRVRASVLSNGNQLVLAVPLTDTTDTLHRLLLVELLVTAGAVVLVGLSGWWLVRLGLRPLADVERTAEAIAGGELSNRVPGENDKTEIGRLARALNVMLGRIQHAFSQRDATELALRQSDARLRQFVADASHELRTPVAAVSAYAELFERGAASKPDDLARVLRGIRVETDRMGQLVEDLLLLARMDEGLPIERVPVDLISVVAESMEAARLVGPEWPVGLEASQPLEVVGDRDRLRQVMDNLLSNVRAHTPPGTSTVVTVSAAGAVATVEVADDGPGLTDEQAARVFERFYRADPSRSRTTGGSGLGLSIVAAIVAAHGGTVDASPGPQHGAVIRFSLPLA